MLITIVLWLLHLTVLFYEWSKKSLGMVLWAMLLVVFTLPHTVHVYIKDYNQNTLETAGIYAIIFIAVYAVIRYIYFYYASAPVLEIEISDAKESPDSLFNMMFGFYIICFLFTAITFYMRGYTLLGSSWSETLDMKQTGLEIVVGQIVVAFSGLGFVCFSRNSKLRFLICVGIYIFCALWSKSRYNLLGIVTPFIIYFAFNKDRKKFITGVSLGILLVFSVFIFQQIRWLGDVRLIFVVGLDEIVRRSIEYMSHGQGELGLLRAFYYFIENNNNFDKFGEGLGYIRLALIFIPSMIAPFKPRDFAIDMYKEWYQVDNPRGTMHPTLFGDTYANFGMFGCLFGVFYALLVTFIDENIRRTPDPMMKIMKVSMACTLFVLLGRGAMYNAIFNFVLGWLVMEAVYLVYRWREEHQYENFIH